VQPPRELYKRVARNVMVPFNCIRTFSFAAATTVSSPVTPAFDALISNISLNFEFYRFTSLVFKSLPCGQNFNFTYYPSNESSSVADSYATIALAGLNRAVSANMSVPVTLNVPKNVLYQSPESWWSTQSGANDFMQGRFVLALPATGTVSITVQVFGMVEFKMPSANATDLSTTEIPHSTYTNVSYPKHIPTQVKNIYVGSDGKPIPGNKVTTQHSGAINLASPVVVTTSYSCGGNGRVGYSEGPINLGSNNFNNV